MSEKHRALPPWMSKDKKEEKVKGPLKSKRKAKAARSVFYCMNEKELVDAAVLYLMDDAHGEHKTEPKTTVQAEEERGSPGSKRRALNPASEEASEEAAEEALEGGDDQDRAYVSESDMDITEAETVSYPECTDSNKEREVHNYKEEEQNVKKNGVSKDDVKEDDAFQLVREIFFT
ncbi:uncharacterized protein [Eucyclogobius newberryi]|uniref:uncharacterized protein n=1 Tax=Eucyclogobius newberryi TaxID=166745 RepID=UPI003B5C4339